MRLKTEKMVTNLNKKVYDDIIKACKKYEIRRSTLVRIAIKEFLDQKLTKAAFEERNYYNV